MKQTFLYRGLTWSIESERPDRVVLVPAPDVAAWRKKKALTQRAAAEQLGISQTHLAKIELGTRACPAKVMATVLKG